MSVRYAALACLAAGIALPAMVCGEGESGQGGVRARLELRDTDGRSASEFATGEPIRARNCHCMRCRRARSAMHASNFVISQDAFRYTHGEENVRSYRLPEAKFFAQSFCSQCGSAAPHVDSERGLVIIPMGAFDDDPGQGPQEHIFVGSKASWFEIPGALPQYEDGPPG